MATDNDLVSGQSWQASLPRLADASRYWLIVKALVLNVVAVAKVYVLVLPLCFFLLGRGPRRPRLALPGSWPSCWPMLAGYFFVYVTTPHDLEWQLATSASRLLMHLWPAAILAVFLTFVRPGAALGGEVRSAWKNPGPRWGGHVRVYDRTALPR